MATLCGLKNCNNGLGPGAARVGFDNNGRNDEVTVCAEHAWFIMTMPRDTLRITPDRTIESILTGRTLV